MIGRNQWRIIYFLGASLILAILMCFLLLYAVTYRYPVKQFLWTSDAQSVCTAIPLTEPNISAARVKDFALRAALALNSYDYINWRRSLDSALEGYFTPSGRSNYTSAFEASGILQRVRKDYYVVSAVSSAEPVISQEGLRDGRYFWEVEVPVTIYYRTNIEVKPENRVLIFTIVRIEPSPLNPNGIAAAGVISRQQLLKDGEL
nr:DotI/IcmL family type IV secretion protein [Microvirga puerhi]